MVRARARGGSRGNRGRRPARRTPSSTPETTQETPAVEDVNEHLVFDQKESYDQNVVTILTGPSSFKQHFDAQNYLRDRYLAILLTCHSRAINYSEGSKAKTLAAAWARKDYQLAEALLGIPGEEFALKEVLKAVNILDAGRAKRAQEKILRRLEAQGCKKKLKMAQIKSVIGTISQDIPLAGSLSGAVIRHIKNWIKTIPLERLEFFALHFPTEPWKKLADILHLHPEKDVPQCPWFLHFAFGKEIPEGAIVSDGLTSDNISTQVLENEIDYTVARKFKDYLTDEAKEKIAGYASIDTVLWYYEELVCPGIDQILKKRLDCGEKVLMSYGKLMERLSTFTEIRNRKRGETSEGSEKTDESLLPFIKNLTEIADAQLQSLSLNLESPVVVIGDKSGSMDIAIKTSNIIASLLTKLANADLVFFDGKNVIPPFIPKNVAEVMELSKVIKAYDSTNPAASLYPYYEKKEVVKTFVMVTDEGENGICHSCNFAELFKKYHKEVYPASLVFISFLYYNPHFMIKLLKKVAPDIKPLVFDFNMARPDLSKLDNVLGILSMRTMNFKADIDGLERKILQQELNDILKDLKV